MRVERQRRPAPTPATPPGPTAQRAVHPTTRSVVGWLSSRTMARYAIDVATTCAQCGGRLPRPLPGPGRLPVYCTPACRQKAYRARGGRASGTTGAQRHRAACQAPTEGLGTTTRQSRQLSPSPTSRTIGWGAHSGAVPDLPPGPPNPPNTSTNHSPGGGPGSPNPDPTH